MLFSSLVTKLRRLNGARTGSFKSQISKSNTVGIEFRLGCLPQRVSESKGQPGVVIGLPWLETNYRVLAFLCSVRVNVCVYVCMYACFCVIRPINGCSLHNPLIRYISSGLAMLIHTHSHMLGFILFRGPYVHFIVYCLYTCLKLI